MDLPAFILFFSTVWLVWARATDKLKADGRGWLFRNWVSGVISLTIGTIQLILMIGEFGVSTVFGFLIAAGSAWLYRQPLPNAKAAAGPVEHSPRVQNDAQPVAGVTIADIEFDYTDAKGADSRRRVEVEAINSEYFQGHCHKADAERTFVIGRVRGRVLDLASGELLAPKAWAAEARKHPLNDPSKITIGRAADDEAFAEDDEASGQIEICFTGYSKADKLRLEEIASACGMIVRQSVTSGLTHLCAGDKPGPAKLDKAVAVGAEIIEEADFYALLA